MFPGGWGDLTQPEWRTAFTGKQRLLHTGASTHRKLVHAENVFRRGKRLHSATFTHGGFYFFHAQMPLHTEAITITQRRFYEQKAFAHRTPWTTGVFTQSCPYMPIRTAFSYTQMFFHANNAFKQWCFYTQAFWRTGSSRKLLHAQAFTHGTLLHTMFLHTGAVTRRRMGDMVHGRTCVLGGAFCR